MTEQEVVETIQRVAKRLSHKYKFGYYSAEDIEQEAFIIVIKSKCLEKYDPSRPLENFLMRHLRNRFYNFKRDNFFRPDPPCVRCPLNAFVAPDICTAYKDKMDCKFYARWENSNTSKKNIMNTARIDNIDDANEKNMFYEGNDADRAFAHDLHDVILEDISDDSCDLYIMYLEGVKLKKKQRDQLFNELQDIYVQAKVDGRLAGKSQERSQEKSQESNEESLGSSLDFFDRFFDGVLSQDA